MRGDRLRVGGDCARAEQVEADPVRAKAALVSLQAMMSCIPGDARPLYQACMRPCTSDGLPVMGAIPGVPGAFISTGHNCWGILWAPASGLAMAQLIATGCCDALDLTPFAPDRFTGTLHNFGRGRTAALS